ncbi:MAG: hypothetical protein ABID87_00165, partial [Chloroflexota bacterium]
MKLVVFGPSRRLGGLLEDGSIVDLAPAYRQFREKGGTAPSVPGGLPSDLLGFIEGGDKALAAGRLALAYARKHPGKWVIRPEGVKIHAPLPGQHIRIV